MKKMFLIVFLLSVFLVGCGESGEMEVDSGVVKEASCNDGGRYKSTIILDDSKKYYIALRDCRLVTTGSEIEVTYDEYSMRIQSFKYKNKNEITPENEE